MPLSIEISNHIIEDKILITVYEQPLLPILHHFKDQSSISFSAKWQSSSNGYFETKHAEAVKVEKLVAWFQQNNYNFLSVDLSLDNNYKVDSNFSDETFITVPKTAAVDDLIFQLKNLTIELPILSKNTPHLLPDFKTFKI